jgi:hypothetical protein
VSSYRVVATDGKPGAAAVIVSPRSRTHSGTATLSFGHNVGGSTLTAPAFTIDIVSSEPAFAVTATATNFVSGANTIPMEKVSQSVNGVVFAWIGYTSGDQIPLGTVSPMSVALSLAVPSAAKTGVYTSTFTFRASN